MHTGETGLRLSVVAPSVGVMEARTVDDLDLDLGQTLDAVEAAHRARVRAEAELLCLAAHFADLHDPASGRQSGVVLPGAERSVRLGGSGTPLVREFAAVELGVRMQLGREAARFLIADALDLRHRLPLLWARLGAGEVRAAWARLAAARTRHLSLSAAGVVDARVAEPADGRIPFARFETVVAAAVVAADPAVAAAREEEAAARRFARASRSSEDGMRMFSIRASLGVVARIDATVSYLAAALRALGDTDSEDDRRIKACLVMANPDQAVQLLAAFAAHRTDHPDDPACGPARDEAPPELPDEELPDEELPDDPLTPRPFRPGTCRCGPSAGPPSPPAKPGFVFDWSRLLPQVRLYVHAHRTTLESSTGGVCRVEGHGPVSVQWVRDQLRPVHRFTVLPVLDVAGQAPVDSYEIPTSHREAVRILAPADCFPFATRVGRDADPFRPEMDIDHTRAYRTDDDDGGGSRIGNYGQLGRFHHRVKTHGDWTVRQPYPGIYVWRDPRGRHYLVDHTGTRALEHSAPAAATGAGPVHRTSMVDRPEARDPIGVPVCSRAQPASMMPTKSVASAVIPVSAP